MAVKRKRKKLPRWVRILRHYTPLICVILAFILCVILLVTAVKAIFNGAKSKQEEKAAEEAALLAEEAIQEPEPEPIDYAALREEYLEKCEKITKSYDYEGAIELLSSLPEEEQTEEVKAKLAEYREEDSKLVTYSSMETISHVFFHSLIVDTERAFDGDSKERGYNLYMTTVQEFRDILDSLYEKGYVLVTPHQVAGEVTDESGTHFAYLEIRLPEGKTPIMMSQDDVNYYGYMIGNQEGMDETPVFATPDGDGFASKIVIGEDGYATCEFMVADGNVLYGEYDLVPILEAFCQEHPDFSYRGARAVLGFTGYEGVMGYRTKPSYEEALGSTRYKQECEEATYVANVLKEQGWLLASHSYGHPAYGEITAEKVRIDSDKWEDTVQPIIGDTDILIYPHGSDIADTRNYDSSNEKFVALYEDGYRYFFNVDNCVAWHQLGENYFRGNRRDLDGYRMYHHPDSMNDLIDAYSILDPGRTYPVPTI